MANDKNPGRKKPTNYKYNTIDSNRYTFPLTSSVSQISKSSITTNAVTLQSSFRRSHSGSWCVKKSARFSQLRMPNLTEATVAICFLDECVCLTFVCKTVSICSCIKQTITYAYLAFLFPIVTLLVGLRVPFHNGKRSSTNIWNCYCTGTPHDW